jgi:phosphate uptake regulator
MERRKIIRQGKATLTMSLPSGWVRSAGLSAGDELAVEERGLQLIVGPALGQRRGRTAEVDLRGYPRGLVFGVLNNLYIRGDDELRLRFDCPTQYEAIAEAVKYLIGFEIVEHSGDTCVLKELARGEGEDFDALLRRILLLLLGMAEDGLEALREGDTAELAAVKRRDDTVNKLVSYCLRMLNKRGGADIQRAMHLYALLAQLEQLGDAYSRLYCDVAGLRPRALAIAKRVARLLRGFYELFYAFDIQKAGSLKAERDAIRDAIDATDARKAGKDDLIALQHLRRIADLIIDIEKFQLAMQL